MKRQLIPRQARDGEQSRTIRLAVIIFICIIFGATEALSTTIQKIYWVDWPGYGDGKIMQSNLDGSDVKELVTGLWAPYGIDIDPVGNKIYWSDHTGDIHRSNLDGTDFENIARLTAPLEDIAVDGIGGKIYITATCITRMNLDGSGSEGLAKGHAQGIDVDATNGKLYWTFASSDEIWRSNLDGTGAQVLMDKLYGIHGLSLDLTGGKIYWTACQMIDHGSIQRANLGGGGIEKIVTGLRSPWSIEVDGSQGKVYWIDCRLNKIQRANLDGSGLEDVVTGIGSPRHITLGPVPEPGTVLLVGLGGLAVLRKRRS